ncbi:hypothetical protein M404DRAFT_994024 [Pisolithus tinctorius Marx 270]|uniref:Uncharacterized protein n=1 Tax=Pisolithus tinctorius Marx 270 TaxID=870435 RepID=A0A0C3JV93_PISTI|nr:hypothetical protein M404DRAFT_994024 [Pisolithus tinctorius Marx 270]
MTVSGQASGAGLSTVECGRLRTSGPFWFRNVGNRFGYEGADLVLGICSKAHKSPQALL